MKRPRLKVQHNKTDGSVGDAGPDQEKRGGGGTWRSSETSLTETGRVKRVLLETQSFRM